METSHPDISLSIRSLTSSEIARELAAFELEGDAMKYGSQCALGGFTPYPVLSTLAFFPKDFGGAAELPQAAE